MERIAPAPSSRYDGSFAHAHYEFRTNPYGRKGGAAVQGSARRPTPTRTRISRATGVRPGMRVRHAQFGVGTVIAVEEHNDDMKITVRFISVGVKKLLAKYAKLEPA